ncbi:hypothetical protein ACQR09_04015 [Bradyrhizobium oligotrophicum]|uniref:hypothetical protein n=1 Tax=Bradyrhizobium oligotrophicum TaxID=44255 RepID=UPI003EBDD837
MTSMYHGRDLRIPRNFFFPFFRNHAYLRPSRLIEEGRTRRHDTWSAGSDGREAPVDDWRFADGEVVWSWRPEAGVKPAAFMTSAPVTGAIKPVPGEQLSFL